MVSRGWPTPLRPLRPSAVRLDTGGRCGGAAPPRVARGPGGCADGGNGFGSATRGGFDAAAGAAAARAAALVRPCIGRGSRAGPCDPSGGGGQADPARAAAALKMLEAQRRQPPLEAPPETMLEALLEAQSGPAKAAEAPSAAHDDSSGGSRGATAAAFARIYAEGEWLQGAEAHSGLGSRADTTREFCCFFEDFLRDRGVVSVVDGGCGHWPSGYQRFVRWQGVMYHGVDVVPRVVAENEAYFTRPGLLAERGLASAHCEVGDAGSPLPAADLLLVKDVLMHLPNAIVREFLRCNVHAAPPRYRYILLVQNEVPPVNIREMCDIEPGQLLPFDISRPPFEAPFRPVFRWLSDEPKVVQLWTAGAAEPGW